ncbi:F-box protein [Legionella sainthelensi]|uniref:F-box domain-containing protein n=1 Tax=Legionella sainthelensi TaxID=28087 RepID=A0A2H5FNX7_9GAMM|nr:F-box protein [Legionella sainthelensi]AUH73271.1 F-box protein [Legionella sainthelensi]
MQDEFKLIDELPPELLVEVAQYLPSRTLINLAERATYYWSLFQPMIHVRKLSYFLQSVVRSDHEMVETMLQKDISLIFNRGKVTDCSGRIFDKISAFEYAIWALDKHMWTIMIACIPCNEEGRKVFEHLITQYTKVETDGITYRLNEKTIAEKHFDFENTLIKELQTQVGLVTALGDINWDAAKNQWREGVGGAQKLVPMHVVYEYCSDQNFYDVPEFSCPGVVATRDLDAIAALYKVRTNDFIHLKSQLDGQVAKDNHHQVSLATC